MRVARILRGVENMHSEPCASRCRRRFPVWALFVLILAPAYAASSRQLADAAKNPDDLWRRTVELVRSGRFDRAAEEVQALPPGPLTDKVRGWLAAYEAETAQRLELNRKDFEMYVRYARERVERKEYALALEKTVRAADNASNRDAFLAEPWVAALVKDALAEADGFRKDQKWEQAWEIYYYLGLLFKNSRTYEKLERECVNHLRLERIFEKDSKWQEPLRDIRMDMATRTLDYISRYYVDEKLSFKKITQAALEQLLMLTESESARSRFEGLGNEALRTQCQERLRERLRQVNEAPSLDWRGADDYFRRALDIVRKTVNLPEELVVSEMLRGALENVDDFTSNIWPAEWDEFQKHTQGDFIGVGISIIKNSKGQVEVVSPLEDTPAFRAGVQPGDIILKVNNQDLSEMSISRVVETITGPKDTTVTLTMRRGTQEFDLTLRRERVEIHTIKGVAREADDLRRWNFWLDREQGIALIRVVNFAKNTVPELEATLSQLKAAGLKGLILDLRGNPGGLLDQAEQMASLFLPRGARVHSINGRIARDNKVYNVPGDGPFQDVPMVILVDENSASASEIVAGALRDNRRAIVLGERTYGKFSVQNLIPISNVPPAALKITTAKYYLPSGVSLHREADARSWGVEPNISIPLVSKEKIKVYQMRRKADVIGVAREDQEDDGDDEYSAPEPPVDNANPNREDQQSSAPQAEAPSAGAADRSVNGTEPSSDTPKPSANADGETPAADKKEEENKLPPLDQPDKNDRPDVDPQLNAALLVMRVTLLGMDFPTLAAAQKPGPPAARHE